jgi:hypothetical protein
MCKNQQIRTQAVMVAIVIGLLLAIGHYGKKLRKPKWTTVGGLLGATVALASIKAAIDPSLATACGPSSSKPRMIAA